MKQELKKSLKRNEIINKARLLFFEQGVEETSVSQIAKAAGIAKGLFYYYFKTKEEVLLQVAQQICDEHICQIEVRMHNEGDNFYSHLLILIDAYYDVYPYHKRNSQIKRLVDTTIISLFHRLLASQTFVIRTVIVKEGKALGYFQMEEPELLLAMCAEGIYSLKRRGLINKQRVVQLLAQSLDIPIESLEPLKDILVNFSKEEVNETSIGGAEGSGSPFRSAKEDGAADQSDAAS